MTDVVPKNLFLLWDKPREDWPEVVELCIPLWQDLNPQWNIVVFDGPRMEAVLQEDLSPGILRPMAIQTKSDFLRLKMLSEQGGIWADATALPLAPLRKWFHIVENADFSAPGFEHIRDGGDVSPNGRDYGNWFLVSKKQGYVTTRLFHRMLEYHNSPKYPIPQKDALGQHISRNWRQFIGPNARELDIVPYFLMHYLTALEIETDPMFREICATNPMPRGVYNYVMSRMARAHTDPEAYQEVLHHVQKAPTPCSKLDWKTPTHVPWTEVRSILVEKTPARRKEKRLAARAEAQRKADEARQADKPPSEALSEASDAARAGTDGTDS